MRGYKQVTVVQGLIIHPVTKKVLLAHRPPNELRPLLWGYPGGKAEPGEDLQEALSRTLKERLGVEVGIGSQLVKSEFRWRENIEVYLFSIVSWDGESKLRASIEIRWVDLDYAIDHLPCAPNVYATYREVVLYRRRHP